MESYYPKRLCHARPPWVEGVAIYHIRIRRSKHWNHSLTEEIIATTILDSVSHYQRQSLWSCRLFLLMPDHLHALLSFDPSKKMSSIVGNWKSFHAKSLAVQWQSNYFDHRIRNDDELSLKYSYILNNPVVKGLCNSPESWPWKIVNF